MAYLFNGATHIINRADAVLQTWPITLHGRIRLTASNDGLDHTIIGLWETSLNNGFRLQIESSASTMKARCGTKAGGTASNATTTTSISDQNWHSVVGEITAANARQVWLDNGGNGSSSTSLTPGTLTKTSIGAFDSGGTLGGNVAHELADVAVWSGTLTADERAALSSGVSPLLIRPDILEIYLPLMRGGDDYMGAAFTVTNATVADHPRVYMPARPQVFKTAAVSSITGTASITEAGDTVSAASALAIAGAASISEAGDTVSAASALAIAGAASISEAGDTASSTSTLALAAALASTEAADTSSATGALAIVGTAAITEAGDTVSASGVGVVSISGTASITEASDTASSAGTLALAAVASITEAGDTVSGVGALAIRGLVAANENSDTVSAVGTIGAVATASRLTGSRPTSGASTLRLNFSSGARPAAVSRG